MAMAYAIEDGKSHHEGITDVVMVSLRAAKSIHMSDGVETSFDESGGKSGVSLTWS